MKYLYKSIFSWLVRKINSAHASADIKSEKFIGILDIFGFEILRSNSFEQLCINFTNERLQQQFNEQIFVAEQEEYAREGLNWTTISFRDNQPVIDLISKKPMGLLYILEEHGMMNRKPDDKALLSSFNSSHDHDPMYRKPRFGNDGFVVKHFAGEVTYSIEGLIIKNNDSLQDDLLELLIMSSNLFVVEALKASDSSLPSPPEAEHPKTHKLAASHTVSYTFRNQLDVLTSALRTTEPQ
jgi:myosin-5